MRVSEIWRAGHHLFRQDGKGLVMEEETVTIPEEDSREPTFRAGANMATGIVKAAGKLDGDTLNPLWATIDLLISGGHRSVTVDLAEVDYVDQAAVALFVALQHGLDTHNGELRLINAPTNVRDALVNGQVAYTDIQT
jgi:anti-anti-sigma factor